MYFQSVEYVAMLSTAPDKDGATSPPSPYYIAAVRAAVPPVTEEQTGRLAVLVNPGTPALTSVGPGDEGRLL